MGKEPEEPESIEQLLARFQRLPNLPEGWERTWRFVIDGVEVPVTSHMVAFLESPGRPAIGWSYGLIDDGNFQYDGCCFTEFGGGGVAMVPFVILDGVLWFLTTLQYRFLVGHAIEGFVRGYKPPGIKAGSHALEEFVEEFGTAVPLEGRPFPLVGAPSFGATHIVDTRPLPNEPHPGGYQFGIQLSEDCFEPRESGSREERPELKTGLFAPKDKLESLAQGNVLRWWEAAESSEAVVQVGALRVMATLRRNRIQFE